MEKYKKFIEVTVPGYACNFKCSYCYISQLINPEIKDVAKFNYSPQHIGKSLNKQRIGGTAYINICGVGETLIAKEMPQIVKEILSQGHFVNIYTNGVLTSRINEILEIVPPENLKRLSFSFSFHFLELKQKKLINTFFYNFKNVKSHGCSVISNMVLDDTYIPYIEEIKKITLENLGAYPQISFPKKNHKRGNWTSLCKDDRKSLEIGRTFNSPYLDFTEKYYNYNKRKFCYAGEWSFCLNLGTGEISKCYGHTPHQNIYTDISTPIRYSAVGNMCFAKGCGGGLFLPQGVVPSLNAPTYPEIKDRAEANWYSPEFKAFLSQQLISNNKQFSTFKKIRTNIVHPISEISLKVVRICRKAPKKLFSKSNCIKNG